METTTVEQQQTPSASHLWLRHLLWIFLSLIFAVLILLYKLSSTPLSTAPTNELFYLVFYNLFGAIIGQYLFTKLSGRKTLNWRVFYMLLFLTSGVLGDRIVYDQKQIFGFKQSVQEIQNSSTSIQGSNRANGVLGEIEAVLKKSHNQTLQLSKEMDNDFTAAGSERLLDANRLKGDKNFRESKEMIQKFNQIIDQYHAKQTALLNSIRQQLTQLSLDEQASKELLEQFDKGAIDYHEFIDKDAQISRLTVTEMSNTIDFLANKKHIWSVENGQFMFTSNSSLTGFNAHIAKIQQLAQQLIDLRTAYAERRKQVVSRLIDN
ncbi:hypothetical protein [Methylomonas sp. AM2-LC]|uniref:hypothetical protein n=1 Tax=Methylomonas sp. AM2-LC TaxID=3153301 RepID=UPI003267FA5D